MSERYTFGMTIFMRNMSVPLVLRSNDLDELKTAHKLLYRAGYALEDAPYSDGRYKLEHNVREKDPITSKFAFIYKQGGCIRASSGNATAQWPYEGWQTWHQARDWAKKSGCKRAHLRDDEAGTDYVTNL